MPVVSPRTGTMSCPRNPSGNMPAVPAPPRFTPGVMISTPPTPIITGTEIGIPVVILSKPGKWGSTGPTPGAFSICTAMSGSGPQTGTQRRTPRTIRQSILPDPHRARIGSSGVVPGAAEGRPSVRLSATATPRATAALSASVLVSKKASSQRARYGRMKYPADGEGGAGRAWTKRAGAQKGHARHAKPRRKSASQDC